jgi:hypothetical protein
VYRAVQVALDRAHRDDEPVGDLGVAEPFAGERDEWGLALG